MCVFSFHSFWTSSSLDVPAGVTQKEGHTGFLIHLLSAVRALIFLARRIQPLLSLVDLESRILCTNDLIVLQPMDLVITILPVVTKGLPISSRFTPYNFLSPCKFSTLTNRQPMAEYYLLTFPRFPLRKQEHNSYFGKDRTHDFCTSRCAGFLLDSLGIFSFSF